MSEPILTAAQQDYLEVIHALALQGAEDARAADPGGADPGGADSIGVRGLIHGLGGAAVAYGVRITDIAAELGTKLPTVTRTVGRLKELGLLAQEERGLVRLTPAGAQLGAQLAHRHADVVAFLTDVLGAEAERAEAEACLIEHGLSGETAQRLHIFMERWGELGPEYQGALAGPRRRVNPTQFTLLGDAAGQGGRQ